jgi:hypothetical protein
MTNLTYQQLIELAPKDQIFKIRVQSNPYGEGGEAEIYAWIDGDNGLSTNLEINPSNFCFDVSSYSGSRYKGTFDLILLTPQTNKGFDPEKLTFDGVEIKSGDEIKIYGNNRAERVFSLEGNLCINCANYNTSSIANIESFNITHHYPQKSELEIAEEELFIIASELSEYLQAKYSYSESIDQLNKFYDIKNKVENLKSNNQ